MKQLKSFLVVLALSFATIGASAQFSNTTAKNNKGRSGGVEVKYQGDVNFGAFIGNATMLTIGTTHGAKISDYFYAGVSINAEVSTDDFSWWNLAPLLSLRGYYPVTENFRVFMNPEFGVSIGIAGEDGYGYYSYENSGAAFEYRLTAGLEYKHFQFGLGCGGAGATSFFTKIGLTF